ncbi:uncharacterized protein RCO7_10400 [Rhynchosporium graminicola]|uniref:Uncharacterized protein n=1 Tax=Rhynchosporium graminicola TaxID=2792576 RepID=A0A1E1L4X3_9HELO|nr:uncharacterized protein RCO7_10400 [Rhynchosporium commune]
MEGKDTLRPYWTVEAPMQSDSLQPTAQNPQSKGSSTGAMIGKLRESQEYSSSSDSDNGGVKLEKKEGSIHTSPYVKIPKRTKTSSRNTSRRIFDVLKISSQIGVPDQTRSGVNSWNTPLARPASKYHLYDPKTPTDGIPRARALSALQVYGNASRKDGGYSPSPNARTVHNTWDSVVPWVDDNPFEGSKGSHNTKRVTSIPDISQENTAAKKAASLSAWAAFPAKAAKEDKADALAYKPSTPGENLQSEIVIKETYKKVVISGDTFKRKIVEKSVNILE